MWLFRYAITDRNKRNEEEEEEEKYILKNKWNQTNL